MSKRDAVAVLLAVAFGLWLGLSLREAHAQGATGGGFMERQTRALESISTDLHHLREQRCR